MRRGVLPTFLNYFSQKGWTVVMQISTFLPLNTGMTALDAASQAESVIANNIANANTPGYAQEVAQLGEYGAFPVLPSGNAPLLSGQTGEGVTVNQVTRQISAFYNAQDRVNQGSYQMYKAHNDILTQIEGILNEPSSQSMQHALDQFFASWQTLSTDPGNTAAAQAVVSQAQSLGQTFQSVGNQLSAMQANLQTVVGTAQSSAQGGPSGQLGELVSYAAQVAQLNSQIVSASQTGASPNTLEDQRSVLLDKMAQLANIKYFQDPQMTGGATPTPKYPGYLDVTLSAGNQTIYLVGPPGSPPQPAQTDAALLGAITSGSIAGNVAGITDGRNTLAYLNAYMQNLASQVNQAYGGAVFNVNPTGTGTPPADSPVVYLTTASAFTASSLSTAGSANPGNNSTAQAVANVQNATTAFSYNLYNSITGVPSSTQNFTGTFDQGVAQIVSSIGTETANTISSEQTANALAQQSSQLRQSVSGVDINQQAAQMVQYQNAYSAAAKFITVFDQMIQTLLASVP